MPGYPIELDLTGRRALVVGLGPVGRRKAAGLLAAGTGIVVGVDPAADPADPGLAGVEVRPEPYRPEHLDGVTLAFAAGPAEVNRRVVADARARGVWVNSASEPASGDFSVPATWREGPVTLAVSTSGASPALAAALRDAAAEAIAPGVALAALLEEIRPTVLARVADPAARRRLLLGWASRAWVERCRAEGPEAARAAMMAELDALVG